MEEGEAERIGFYVSCCCCIGFYVCCIGFYVSRRRSRR
jgi:hypothetical protein